METPYSKQVQGSKEEESGKGKALKDAIPPPFKLIDKENRNGKEKRS